MIIMFGSKFINAASTMLLELVVNVESSRIDRQKEAVDGKGTKCQRISGSCFHRNPEIDQRSQGIKSR